MKGLIFALFLFISAHTYSQTTDSTSIKLEQYKEMFSKGLITATEYEALKGKLLGLPTQSQAPTNQPTKVTLVRIPNEVASYRSKNIVGGVFTGVGMGLFVGDFAYIIATRDKVNPTIRKSNIIAISVASGVTTLIGATLLVVGDHEKRVYQSKSTALDIRLNNNGVGLALKF